MVVHTAHGFGHSHHGSRPWRALFAAAEIAAGRITDGFTGDSAATVHQGRSEGLFGAKPARVVYCGIDVDAFAAGEGAGTQARRSLAIPREHRVVLNLSCLEPQKPPPAPAGRPPVATPQERRRAMPQERN